MEIHGIILQRRTARAKSTECGVFDKVLSNQYQMVSASIFVPAAQNMPHIKVSKITSAEINEWNKMGSNQVSKDAPVVSSISKVLRSGWFIRHCSHIVPDHAESLYQLLEGVLQQLVRWNRQLVWREVYANVQVGDGLLSSTVIFPTLVRCT